MIELILSLGVTVAYAGIALMEWGNCARPGEEAAAAPRENRVFFLLGFCIIASYAAIWGARLG